MISLPAVWYCIVGPRTRRWRSQTLAWMRLKVASRTGRARCGYGTQYMAAETAGVRGRGASMVGFIIIVTDSAHACMYSISIKSDSALKYSGSPAVWSQ